MVYTSCLRQKAGKIRLNAIWTLSSHGIRMATKCAILVAFWSRNSMFSFAEKSHSHPLLTYCSQFSTRSFQNVK
ncbi:hypothetical protein FF011L_01770 [Roseimaritima multifibrata]|uniref:Uncharacterized protein n=1 Tax=Roseimaritima multifibrata TaxID=1930274 RepID=A0A517M9I6_9BACT|nr:hypothetical protein FF011L_01770 [Roseimaritima multifibrata]